MARRLPESNLNPGSCPGVPCQVHTGQGMALKAVQESWSDPALWCDTCERRRNNIPRDAGRKSSKRVWVDAQQGGQVGHFKSVGLHAGPGDLEVAWCRKLCEDGRAMEAVDALNRLVERGCHVAHNLFYRLLKMCIARKDLVLGTRIHALCIQSGYEGNAFLATHLIGLYASHGRLEEAMRVFSTVTPPSAHNWASLIFAYARHGQPMQAIGLYLQMRESAVKPDNRVFVAVLKACAAAGDLAAGIHVHAHIRASTVPPDIYVETCLVHMYAKCGSLQDAQRVFVALPHKNVVTWNSMFAGYAHQGMGREALQLFSCMQQEGISRPTCATFACLLQACAAIGVAALHNGKNLHAHIVQLGLQHDVVVGSSLVNMYGKCGSLQDARRVFDNLPHKNVVTWTTMIAGYAQQGFGQEALSLYTGIQQEGITSPDTVTFVCLLQACAHVGEAALRQGKQLHAHIQERGLQHDVVLCGSLVHMYAKCGSLEDARSVFDRLADRNVVTWTAMIAGYAQQGLGQEALSLYKRMQQEGFSPPDIVTFVCLLQACASVGVEALREGRQLHTQLEQRALQDDTAIGNSLINMYMKCGSLEDARRVFQRMPHRDVVTCTTMIAGYAQLGMGQDALSLYSSMQQEGISAPNSVTFVCLLQACSTLGLPALHEGRRLHAQIEQLGLQTDVVVGASLVNMYANCGSLEDAQKVFGGLSQKDIVTWTTMIAGYARQGMGQEALSLYSSMQQEGISLPDAVTFVCLLQASSCVGALPLGKQLHAQIEDRGLQGCAAVGNSLVDMYAKCGSMVDAQQVFDSLPERNVITWNAMIAGYGRQGDSELSFDLFHRMRQEGIKPDGITLLSVLMVCGHIGLVDKGRKYFEAMRTDFGISPTIEHFTAVVDLLGRAGHLEEALVMVKTMPFKPASRVGRTLLGACQKWMNLDVGRQAFEFAVKLDEKDAAAYVLMSNIYAGVQMWEEAKEMQARRVNCGARKAPGKSWCIDTRGVMHSFVVGCDPPGPSEARPSAMDVTSGPQEAIGCVRDRACCERLFRPSVVLDVFTGIDQGGVPNF